ncbi:MAG: T9SS type A sorting domain-containing protein, partial [Bacteroidetes bacterium]|nr:T9SS type A sorting domain-containing protein [Bacteroidota bacterium]
NRYLPSTSVQFTPVGLQSVPVPVNVDLNIRVRPMVNGSYLEFGPACRYRFIPNAAHRDNDGRVLMFDDAGVTMTLYPNPNRGGTVYLRMEGLAEATTPVDITIYDALGQQVHAERTVEADGSLNHAMDLGRTLGAGMYVVNVTIGDQRFTQRLVMQ